MAAFYSSTPHQHDDRPPASHYANDMNSHPPQYQYGHGSDDNAESRAGAGLLSYFRLGSGTTSEDKPHAPPAPLPHPPAIHSHSTAQYEQQQQLQQLQPNGQGGHQDYSAMTLQHTNFRPMTTQPSKCNKLKVRIYFDSTIFQAGGTIFGRMEITGTSSRSLKLGEIAVELAAYEEISSRECTATQSFLSSRLSFQGPGIPPSNAVYGSSDENGFFMARKGKTTFPFAFQLPLDCPSSLIFGTTASLRYVVTGLVQILYHGKEEMVAKSKEAFVVEAWDGYNAEHRMPVRASNSTRLFWGGAGSLELEAVLPETLYSAGGNLSVEIRVRNNTARKVQGVRLGVARQLIMVPDKSKAELNPHLKIDTMSISEIVGTQEFKASAFLFDPGEERTMMLNMTIPINARTIRGTALCEVTCSVIVSMLLGAFSGELSVELPVKICHPASLTPAPKPTFMSNQWLDDADMDVASESGRDALQATRRVGSSSSLARPISPQRGGEGRGIDDSSGGDGEPQQYPQGDHEDDRQLSPANSITSIRSILKSSKLSKLADRIGRSTSPSAVSHLGIENDPRKRPAQKSTPLGPAQPIAYVPAVERVRYTPFQAPPTAKAKEFLKAATEYQNQLGLSGALEGYENKEIDLADGAMATAIHDWLAQKEVETGGAELQRGRSRLKKRGGITANRQLRQDDDQQRQGELESTKRTSPKPHPISTSPTPLHRQQPRSPSFGSPADDSPREGLWSGQASPTSDAHAFPRTTRRAPAAPQTEAFGSAPEDSIVTPPLFHRPLPCPLPSSPSNMSPTKPGNKTTAYSASASSSGANSSSSQQHQPQPQPQQRARSQSPVPLQTPENLLLAREAFERVKRMSSPARDASLSSSYEDQDRPAARASRLSSQPITGPGAAGSAPSESGGESAPSSAPRGPAVIIPEGHRASASIDDKYFHEPVVPVVTEPINLEHEAKIKVPVPTLTGAQQSALSKLLRDADDTNDNDQDSQQQKHMPDVAPASIIAPNTATTTDTMTHAAVVPPERNCRTPELSHVPMNRPLPAPKTKPTPANPIVAAATSSPQQPQPQQNIQLNPAPLPAPRSSRPPQPQPTYSVPPITLARANPPSTVATITNKHVAPVAAPQPMPRPSPLPSGAQVSPYSTTPPRAPALTSTITRIPSPSKRAPAPVATTVASAAPAKPIVKKPAVPVPAVRPSQMPSAAAATTKPKNAVAPKATAGGGIASTPPTNGNGFVYPKAPRKPVAAPKPPVVAAKPKTLASTPPSSTTTMAASIQPVGSGASVVPIAVARGPQISSTTADPAAFRSRSPLRDQQQQEYQRAQHVSTPATAVTTTHAVPQMAVTGPSEEQQQTVDPAQGTSGQDPYGFRAPPIAMASSIRVQGMMADPSSSIPSAATGPPSSSSSSSSLPPGQPRYAVNTTVLRQAIGAPPRQQQQQQQQQQDHPASSSTSSGGVADLLQGAKNVASAAVAGLVWRHDNTDMAASTQDKRESHGNHGSALGIEPLPRGSAYSDRTIQHDLTMKDIDFQTVRDNLPPAMTASSSSVPYPPSPPSFATSAAPAAFPRATSPTRAVSPSRPSSHSSGHATHLDSLSADVNLDKTLPKIHENAANRLELQADQPSSSYVASASAPSVPAPMLVPAPRKSPPPLLPSPPRASGALYSNNVRPPFNSAGVRSTSPGGGYSSGGSSVARNGLRVGLTTPHAQHPPGAGITPLGAGAGAGAGGAKAINPRLQAYIQKYNLAASARS